MNLNILEQIDPELAAIQKDKYNNALIRSLLLRIQTLERFTPKQGEPGKNGVDGESGYTPIKGIDYFTAQEIDEIIKFVYNVLKQEIKPGEKGEPGRPGRPGKDGKSIDKEELKTLINQYILAYETKNESKEKFNIEEIVESVIKEITKNKRIDISNIKNARLYKGKTSLEDLKWHGGGMTLKAGTGQTLSQNSDGTWTLTPQSLSFETPTGAVDASNTTFTVLNTPKSIIMDGTIHFENYGYTLSGLTITTDRAPVLYIKSMY